MRVKEAEIAAVSASLIASLGAWDWWTRGSVASLMTGAFGLFALGVLGLSLWRRGADPDD